MRSGPQLSQLAFSPTARQLVCFLKSQPSGSPKFGLDRVVYKPLTDEATVIIYNAWTVNNVLPGEAFQAHLAGQGNLLHFSYWCATAPNLFLRVEFVGIAYTVGNSTSRGNLSRSGHRARPFAFKVRRGENGGGVH